VAEFSLIVTISTLEIDVWSFSEMFLHSYPRMLYSLCALAVIVYLFILVKMTNKMQLCRTIYYCIVPWLLYMFRAILSLIIGSILTVITASGFVYVCYCRLQPYTLSVKLSDFTVWRHTWRKNWVKCAVLTGSSAGLKIVLFSRLSHRELCSSLRESYSFPSLLSFINHSHTHKKTQD